MKSGDRIRKINSEVGDGHKDGSSGRILNIINVPKNVLDNEDIKKNLKGRVVEKILFIEWDDMPGIPVGVLDYKCELVSDEQKEKID